MNMWKLSKLSGKYVISFHFCFNIRFCNVRMNSFYGFSNLLRLDTNGSDNSFILWWLMSKMEFYKHFIVFCAWSKASHQFNGEKPSGRKAILRLTMKAFTKRFKHSESTNSNNRQHKIITRKLKYWHQKGPFSIKWK